MDRRNFLRTLVGGVAAGAAVRTWPFRVYSFPTEIVVPPTSYLEYYVIRWPPDPKLATSSYVTEVQGRGNLEKALAAWRKENPLPRWPWVLVGDLPSVSMPLFPKIKGMQDAEWRWPSASTSTF